MRNYNEYMREYILRRYHERMNEARLKLGNRCCKCSRKDKLDLDHINPKDKSFAIGKLWSLSKDVFDKEVLKCQLLCEECHKTKTLTDFGKVSAKATHGTLSSYRYCKCKECKAAKAKYTFEHRREMKKKFFSLIIEILKIRFSMRLKPQ